MKRICLARKLYAPLKWDIRAAYDRLIGEPQKVTVRDVDLMSACIYGDRFTGSYYDASVNSSTRHINYDDGAANRVLRHGTWKEREIPGPPAGTPALEYAYWLSSPANITNPTRDEIEFAKSRLRADFGVVGFTEDMPSFFALVAMTLHWPLSNLCKCDSKKFLFRGMTHAK